MSVGVVPSFGGKAPPTSLTASGRWGLGSLRRWAGSVANNKMTTTTTTTGHTKSDGPPGGKTTADYKRIFHQLDRLGRGSIEYGPLVSLLHQLGLPHVTEQHARAFCSLIDLDNRNGLDLEEFSRIRAVFNAEFDFNATPFFAADFAAQHNDPLGNVVEEGDEVTAARAEGGDQIKRLAPSRQPSADANDKHPHGGRIHPLKHGHRSASHSALNTNGTASQKGPHPGTASMKARATSDGLHSIRVAGMSTVVASLKGARGGGLNSFRMTSLRNLNTVANDKMTPRTKMRTAPKSQSMFDLGGDDDDAGPQTTRLMNELASRAPWRKKISRFVEHPIVVWTIIVLLIIDVIRFFISLLILEGLFGDNEGTREADDILDDISIGLLSVFMLEISLLLISMGRSFFRRPGYCVDFVVVPTAFALEIWYGGVGGFLVIPRLWRLIRVFSVGSDKNTQMVVSKLRALDKCMITVQNNFNRIARALQHKSDAVVALRTELIWINHPNPDSPIGVAGRRKLLEVDGEIPPAGPKPFDLQALEVKNEVMTIFDKFDVRSEGQISPADLKQTLTLANIFISDATAALVVAMFDRARNGYWEIGEFATIRDVLNGRWGMPDLLLDDTQFEATMKQLRYNVTHVRIEENEDPELHGQPSSTKKLKSDRARWRQKFATFLQSDQFITAVVVVLFMDLIRFFLTLLILEDVFSSTAQWRVDEMTYALKLLSIIFLSLFSLELFMLIIALGCDFFRTSYGYIFDLIVVPTCLVLEVLASTQIGGFLIVARLWRIVGVLRKVAHARRDKITRKESETEAKLIKFQNNFHRLAERVSAKHLELQQIEAELFKARKSTVAQSSTGTAPELEAMLRDNARAMGLTANTKVTTSSSSVTSSNVVGRVGPNGVISSAPTGTTSVRPSSGPTSRPTTTGTIPSIVATTTTPTSGVATNAPTSSMRALPMPSIAQAIQLSAGAATSPGGTITSTTMSSRPYGDDDSDDEPMPAAAAPDDDIDLPLPGTIADTAHKSASSNRRNNNSSNGPPSARGDEGRHRGSLAAHKRGHSASMQHNNNNNGSGGGAAAASTTAAAVVSGGSRAGRASGKNQIAMGIMTSPTTDHDTIANRNNHAIITIDPELPVAH